jgi:hypothetical protein
MYGKATVMYLYNMQKARLKGLSNARLQELVHVGRETISKISQKVTMIEDEIERRAEIKKELRENVG